MLAFLGENGAGKSTLLKILNGDYEPDAGTLTIDGEPLSFANPREARAAGIRVIYQEPEIIPGVDVAENIFAGELPVAALHRPASAQRPCRPRAGASTASSACCRAGAWATSSPRRSASSSRSCARSSRGMRVLALDEPTSSLSDEEVDRLFALVRRLRSEGVAIIYVSHRLHEILQLADRVAILRDGRLVMVAEAADLTEDQIVRNMVGRDLGEMFQRSRGEPGAVVLQVEDIRSDWHRGVSFELHAGEVVGFAGLVGAGRTELAKVIFGELPRTSGRIHVDGRRGAHRRSPARPSAKGIGFAPEDRKREGLVLVRSVVENVTMAILRRLTRFRIVQRRLERRVAADFVERLNVRTPSLDQEVGKLSGGNQQKVVLARWLAARPKVLILDEPTRGIDVGAKAEIYRLIDALAAEGLAIMLISSELAEVLGMSDRIYVMQGGRITGELPGPGTTEEQVLELAMHEHLTARRRSATAAASQGEDR